MIPLDRILIIDNSPGFTGAFNSIFQSAKALRSSYQFYFLLPKASANVELLTEEGFIVYESNFIEISKRIISLLYPFMLVFNAIKLLNLMRKEDINIVHVNDMYNMVGVVAKIFNPRIVLIHHARLLPTSYARRLYRFWRRILQSYANEIICVSEKVAVCFINGPTVLIYDSIELPVNAHFSQHSTGGFRIIYVANYIEGKGQKKAIEALSIVLSKISKCKLTFYGDTFGNPKNIKFKLKLQKYAEDLGLRNKIEFKGFLNSYHGVAMDYDLALNFSESESFSMTTLESLANGIPIIATDSGGPSEIIEDNQSGIIVPVNDISAMAAGIIYMAEHEEVRALFSKNGKSRVESKFNIKKQSVKLNQLYSRLLTGRISD